MTPVPAAGRLPAAIVDGLSTLTAAMAAVVLVAGVARALRAGPGSLGTLAGQAALALELLLAGGLVRLGSTESFPALGAIAAIVAVRQVVARGLQSVPD